MLRKALEAALGEEKLRANNGSAIRGPAPLPVYWPTLRIRVSSAVPGETSYRVEGPRVDREAYTACVLRSYPETGYGTTFRHFETRTRIHHFNSAD